MEFKDFILFEATKTAMLDVSIPNIDKVLKDESQIIFFLDKQIKVYEKFDGTKLTLLRNEQPFLNDYRNNWIVSYKGNVLYQYGFTENDHVRLSNRLKSCKFSWLLSYDDCPETRKMYSWATCDTCKVNYSITTARTKQELLIHL